MRREIDRLEAEFLRRLHRFDAGHGALAERLSTVSWLRAACGVTARAAAYRVHLARTLGELPAALDSARAGRASFGNVAMIGHLAGDVGVAQVQPYEAHPRQRGGDARSRAHALRHPDHAARH